MNILAWVGSLAVWGVGTTFSLAGAALVEGALKPISIRPKADGRSVTTLRETVEILSRPNRSRYENGLEEGLVGIVLLILGLFFGAFPWHSQNRKRVGLALAIVSWIFVWYYRDAEQWDKFTI